MKIEKGEIMDTNQFNMLLQTISIGLVGKIINETGLDEKLGVR